MKKYILASVDGESMEVTINAYDTYEEAYAAMEREYNEYAENEYCMDADIYNNSAFATVDYYDYLWQIKEFDF